jgi:hypothetical protein
VKHTVQVSIRRYPICFNSRQTHTPGNNNKNPKTKFHLQGTLLSQEAEKKYNREGDPCVETISMKWLLAIISWQLWPPGIASPFSEPP